VATYASLSPVGDRFGVLLSHGTTNGIKNAWLSPKGVNLLRAKNLHFFRGLFLWAKDTGQGTLLPGGSCPAGDNRFATNILNINCKYSQ